MICTNDQQGRTVWLSTSHEELVSYAKDIHANGERYRIFARSTSVLGSRVYFYAMVITKKTSRTTADARSE